jgi:TATA-binding protein-associated factor Taf7
VYDLQTGGVVQELLGHTGANHLFLSLRHSRFAVAEHDTISSSDVVNSAAFHPFEPLVATSTGDRKYAVQMKNFDDAGAEPKEGDKAERATGAAGDQTATTEKGKEKEEDEPEEAEEESEQQRRPHQQNVLALWSQLARRQTPGEL